MSWLLEVALGICMIILAGGVVNWVNLRLRAAAERRRDAPGSRGDELGVRLDEIERRLTDVQDVMVALSEKLDRWEDRQQTH